MKSVRILVVTLVPFAFVTLFYSCSKSGSNNPVDKCSGISISISLSSSTNTPCQGPAGTVSANATGGTGFTYSINGGPFQASGTFDNLQAGSYTVTVKDANGCSASKGITVENVPPGTLFSDVRSLMQVNCAGCHNNSQTEGGMNWTIDCNIVNNKDRIKARAIDSNPSPMPPTGLLPQAERDKITAWLNAGGKYTD